jgi:hypothetical protein
VARVKFKTSQAELSKLQRVACLGITGAIKTVPTAAMEVLLGLPPLHLQVEADAMIGGYRLRCNEQWKQNLRVLDMHTWLGTWKKNPSYRWGLIK